MVYFPPIKTSLLTLNSLLLSLLLYLLHRHTRQSHSKSSWSFIFLVTSLSWVLLREGFFVCTLTIPQKWTSTQFYLLYWLPSPLQFSSFMILPLFYAEIYHRRSNLVYKWLIRPFFLALEVGMVAYMVAWSWIESMRENEEFECASEVHKNLHHHSHHTKIPSPHTSSSSSSHNTPTTHTTRYLRSSSHHHDYYYTEPTDDDYTLDDDYTTTHPLPHHPLPSPIRCVKYDYSSSSFRILTSISFFLLAIVLSVYSPLVQKKLSTSTPRRRRFKTKTMGKFNDWMLVTVFLSRSIYHLLLLLSVIHLPEMSLKRGTDLRWEIGLIFVMWDYVPTFLVLHKMNYREREMTRRVRRRRTNSNQRIARKKGQENPLETAPLIQNSYHRGRTNFPDYGVFSMIQENSALNNPEKISVLPSSATEHFYGGGGVGSLSSLESSFDGRGR
ncbi:hypothetical protein TrLO_g1649 [Triparma laevis f. longispina]|nr:hypothetical protein TrLO_g1649 [Triparma laevis f. longispina]